jgi:hypothetical protein
MWDGDVGRGWFPVPQVFSNSYFNKLGLVALEATRTVQGTTAKQVLMGSTTGEGREGQVYTLCLRI